MLQTAVEELYSSPMAEFTARRKNLAAAARKSGEREIAAQIAGLRKPTLSADTLNRLVRAASGEVDELLDLGAELRAAEKALDGSKLRELSAKRRLLVGELTKLAFDITDQSNPSAAVREEVSGTLNAALADEEVADRLLSGSLVSQARWDGFGSTSLPELAAVLPMDAARRSRAAGPGAQPPGKQSPVRTDVTASSRARESVGKAGQTVSETEQAAAKRKEQEADRRAEEAAAVKARAETERRRRVEAAQREAEDAAEAADSAQQALSVIDRRIGELSLQLAHERRLLADAQRTLRTAEGADQTAIAGPRPVPAARRRSAPA